MPTVKLKGMFNRISVELQPENEVELPYSDGHLVYASLLGKVQERDAEASEEIHDSDIGINVSCLDGPFQNVEEKPAKKIFDDAVYDCDIVLYNFSNEVTESFMSVVKDMLFSGESISIGDGLFNIVGASVEETEIDSVVRDASSTRNPEMRFDFNTPTCIRHGSHGVFESFPNRMGVFGSLRERWNRFVKEELQIELPNERIGNYCYELGVGYELNNHKAVVGKYEHDNKKKPIKRHGFTGSCTYRVVDDCPEDVKDSLVILSEIAEFIGVGVAVARGCGSVQTEVVSRSDGNL